MNIYDLSGKWDVMIDTENVYLADLPGTLDGNSIGYKDKNKNQWKPAEVSEEDNEKNDLLQYSDVIKTRLTRAFTYEGEAFFSRNLELRDYPKEKRVFLDIERTRLLKLRLNGQDVLPYTEGTISTPYIFEVTDFLKEENRIELICDNSYKGWPHDAILYSSAATDETQTNWNGILGYLRLRWEKKVFLSNIRVYPRKSQISIKVDIDASVPYTGVLRLSSPAFEHDIEQSISIDKGIHTISFKDIPVGKDCKRWDEFEGNLYELSVDGDGIENKIVTFGIRDFEDNKSGRLALNGRTIFLRSDTNCCVFPETGHMPTSVSEWLAILETYKSYGVNCVRFHSHCPPKAAFIAADQLGMLMQPELSHWNPSTAFEDEESWNYYRLELRQILLTYANHPSFVMLAFGNELHASELGHQRMNEMLRTAKDMDPTRLYASGSNNHYGWIAIDNNNDFHTSSSYYDNKLRGISSPMIGHINESYPNAKTNYDEAMDALRKDYKGPVFSFEVGQYEVLPDFDEIDCFAGITLPDNFNYIKQEVIRKGFYLDWKKRVEATGELAKIAYREEVEAVLRTKDLSGISLLSLQDFPGQGTALVGMLNSHLCPKPYPFAQAENFNEFFRDVLPMALLEKYTYTNNETLSVAIQIANYGKKDILAPTIYEFVSEDYIVDRGELAGITIPCGEVTMIGRLEIPLSSIHSPRKLILKLSVDGHRNEYPVWVYPDYQMEDGQGIVICKSFDEMELELAKGSKVLYSPIADEDHIPNSVKSQFTTDFWSVGTFANQSGCMGCLIEASHPIFTKFPTETHSNWQWWAMSNGRAVILPGDMEAIVTVMDSYARLRQMALLFECRVGSGKLIVSSMGLLEQQEYPEVRALTHAIMDYMNSNNFIPKQELDIEIVRKILT